MNEIKGKTFSLVEDNQPIDGLTISYKMKSDMVLFSLGRKTDISSESYDFPCFIHVLSGKGKFNDKEVSVGDFLFYAADEPVGKKTEDGVVYVEYHL